MGTWCWRRVESPVFRRIESLSPRNHVHHFRLRSPADRTDEFDALLREACAVGEQKHLARHPPCENPRRVES
jgi:hypothetical protein